MPDQQTDWLPEVAPYRVGDAVWLVKDIFDIGLTTPGIVINSDIPVARAYQFGMDSVGIVEVEFAAAHRRVQSHWTNFTTNAPREPLLAYMTADSRAARSAAFLRTYAARVRDGSAVSWEIPNTLATTLEDIAALLESSGEVDQ